MNDRDQAIAILPDVENHVSINVIGVPENLPHFKQISPSGAAHDLVPGAKLSCGVGIVAFGLLEVLPSDDVHANFLNVAANET
jgi:hypothetical protein